MASENQSNVLLRRKVNLAIALLTLVIASWLLYDFIVFNNAREEESEKIGYASNELISNNLDSILQEVVVKTYDITQVLEAHPFTETELIEYIEMESRSLDLILGITIAYEPYMFSDSIPLFAPYYDKSMNSLMDIANVYDYTDSTLNTALWYTNVVATKESVWSEPYFAQGAQAIVSDFGVPFYKEVNGKRVVAGTVTLTIALESLSQTLNSISMGTTGFAFLASAKGTIVSHPTAKYILNVNLDDLGEYFGVEEKIKRVHTEKQGFLEYKSVYTNADSYMFFNTLEVTQWKCMVVFATNDLMGNNKELGNKVVNISIAIAFLILIWMAVLVRISNSTTEKLWFMSAVASFLMVGIIVVVWWLNIKKGYAMEENNSIRIMNQTELYSYVLVENSRLIQLGYDPYMTINTGIYVEEMAMKDSYSISIRGKIWQKWPMGLDKEFPPNFHFVQESPFWGTKKELIKKTSNEEMGENYYLWEFSTTLKLALKYSKYPFDSRDVNIQLAYPDLQSNILLVPDLEAYKVLNPSAFPGINKNIYFSKSNLESTYFSFEKNNYHSQFGNTGYKGDDEFPVMEFNVNLKRRFLNAFVINIIPIFVVASMIFLIFYSNSKRKDSNTGVSMMNVVQSCAGFFFVLLLAHTNLRRELSTPEISYMETFYFTMYVIIGLLAINVVAFTKNENSKILQYEDNLIIKLAYWPLLLGSWMVITLLNFYN
ncbi:MAG: cache domain-containing protein [Reichenbachiella sp.]